MCVIEEMSSGEYASVVKPFVKNLTNFANLLFSEDELILVPPSDETMKV